MKGRIRLPFTFSLIIFLMYLSGSLLKKEYHLHFLIRKENKIQGKE